MTWHVANVTNLIISTESLTGANIEVRHAKNESSMIMDRCGTQTSVILHKFAKVPWLKLRRDNSVMDSDLKIAAVNTKPMAIEEIGSDEERQTRLRRKKETLGMDDTLEVPLTRGSEGSDARGSRDPVAHPVETSTAQRTARDLVLWSGGDWWIISSQLRRKGKPEERASQLVQLRQRKLRTSSRTRVSATGAATACELELRTITSGTTTQRARVPDHHGGLLPLCKTHLSVNCSRSWTC